MALTPLISKYDCAQTANPALFAHADPVGRKAKTHSNLRKSFCADFCSSLSINYFRSSNEIEAKLRDRDGQTRIGGRGQGNQIKKRKKGKIQLQRISQKFDGKQLQSRERDIAESRG
jgi:hypothetical protein